MPAAAAACSALLRLELDSIRLVSRSPKVLFGCFGKTFLFVCSWWDYYREEEEKRPSRFASSTELGRRDRNNRAIMSLPDLMDSVAFFFLRKILCSALVGRTPPHGRGCGMSR
jgi:hypothetical protein